MCVCVCKMENIYINIYIYIENGKIKTDLYVKPTDTHQYLHSSSCHPITVKGVFLIVKRSTLIGFAQILCLLIGDVMTWKEAIKKKNSGVMPCFVINDAFCNICRIL